MADKKAKHVMSQREKLKKLQSNRDRETLEHLKYVGHQIEMENSLIKSQILDMRKPAVTERTLPSMTKSVSSVHLPPIKKIPEQQKRSFLDDIRVRDWKLYMNSREVLKGNEMTETKNQELKRKLFKHKYGMLMKQTKENCKGTWKRLEELQNLQGLTINDTKGKSENEKESKPVQKDQTKPAVPSQPTKDPKPADPKPKQVPKDGEF